MRFERDVKPKISELMKQNVSLQFKQKAAVQTTQGLPSQQHCYSERHSDSVSFPCSTILYKFLRAQFIIELMSVRIING